MIFSLKKYYLTLAVIFLILFLTPSPFQGAGLSGLLGKGEVSAGILITEVQIAGETANNDFIEIYNNSIAPQNISGFKFRKKTSTGSETSIRVLPNGSTIEASGYFVWANSSNNFSQSISANASSSSTLAKNNSIAFLDSDGNIIDAVVWGDNLTNPFIEGEKFSTNPEAGQSLSRKFISASAYQDSNNNASDFILEKNPTPGRQNSVFIEAQPEPPPAPAPNPAPAPEPVPIPEPTPDPAPIVMPETQSASIPPTPVIASLPLSIQSTPIITTPPLAPPKLAIASVGGFSSLTQNIPSFTKTTESKQTSISQSTSTTQNINQNPSSSTMDILKNNPPVAQITENKQNTFKEIGLIAGIMILAFFSGLGLIFIRK